MDKYLLLFAIFMLSLVAHAQDQKTLVATGDKYYGKKDYKNALAAYLAAQDLNPDDAAVNFKIGLTYLYSETKSKAASYISKAYRLTSTITLALPFRTPTNSRRLSSISKISKRRRPTCRASWTRRSPSVTSPTLFRKMS